MDTSIYYNYTVFNQIFVKDSFFTIHKTNANGVFSIRDEG